MPFSYSCFISYRHTENESNRKRTKQIAEALKGELEYVVPLNVYLDVERLKGAPFYNESLASALCQSVCMVMLYWPTYFSMQHTFCSREYKLMEKLETQRLQILAQTNSLEAQNGLIIVLAVRGFHSIPEEIRSRRKCYDLESWASSPSMTKTLAFRQTVIEIADYIANRSRILGQLPTPPDPCEQCPNCRLPSIEDVLPWLQQVDPNQVGLTFRSALPTRQIGYI
ncbi:hypothetical protein H7849_18010 [Alloacidobacterium dinghuense]|uniref:TIR domain-containing protein n=1 Tax=Alloacidobacterium dinghuense TaxID=2763107 RepID=A0A7G8BEM2_9BACT|nr:hypothetical protein [Alloacidobacterium dinghuense]QNI30992.1 hypothetical protein H7849_18010 [Alloacidobacterium dinghuense]